MLSLPSLYWATLALTSAVTTNAFQLPLEIKKLNCAGYPKQNVIVKENPAWNEEYKDKLIGVPNDAPNVYDYSKDICTQHKKGTRNAECGEHADEPTGCVDNGQWAFTYDDGPSKFTPNVIKTLDEAGDIKATFFVIGSNICENAPNLIKAINAGHEIGVHTWSHPRLSTLTNGQIIAEIKWTEKAIMEVTGIKPKYMRPPYGNMDNRVRFIINALGYTPVMWTADTNDWAYNNVDANDALKVQEGFKYIRGNITEYVSSQSGATPGTISLEHDIAQIPTDAAKDVIKLVQGAGWKNFVPMTTCLKEKSFAQNMDIIAGKPNGKKPDASNDLPANNANDATSSPTGGASPSKQAENAQGNTQDNAAPSLLKSLRETMFVAAAAGVAIFAFAI